MFRQVLTVTVLSLSYVLRCEAQVVSAFQWKWGKTILGDLSECQTLPIQIIGVALADNPNSIGVPPYYMMAFKFGGVPTTTLIGSDATNLSWTVNHAKGSQLLLTVADSVGNVGGIPNTIYNITAGSDQSCIPTQLPTSSLVSIKPNVTDSLSTCQPWGLTLSGGTKPYQVVLAAKGSPVITNVTMGAGDDVLTYPNRADPNGFLMASVIDAAGHWGISTNGIPTRGSTDTSCGGENPSSKTTQEIEQEEKDRDIAEKAASRKHSTKVILEAVLGTIIPLIAIALGIFFFLRRRKLRRDINRGVWDGQDTIPRAYSPPVGPDGRPLSQEVTWNDVREVGPGSASSGGGMFFDPKLGYIQDSMIPLLHSATSPSFRDSDQISPSRAGTQLPAGALPPLAPETSLASFNSGVQPDIIIQHRDGGIGGVVQELPPPYADSRPAGPSSSSIPLAETSLIPSRRNERRGEKHRLVES